jgi:PAS domain S-box-containing protein
MARNYDICNFINNKYKPTAQMQNNTNILEMNVLIDVLLVDDEQEIRDISKEFLELKEGISVHTATSAGSALEQIKNQDYDIIVSDYQMPEKDGIQLLKEIRGTGNHIPFILFTGKGREEIAIEAFENGADFYLQKGCDTAAQFAELGHKIRRAVELRRADMEVVTLNRLYTVLSATNRAIVRIHDKRELLNEICRINVDIGGFSMVWAGLVNLENYEIGPIVACGNIDEYLDTIALSIDDISQGEGPVGTAFREKTFHICNDITNDTTMEPWREEAKKCGFRSLASFPFALNTKDAGVITLYASESGFFTDKIIRLLDEQSGDLTWAVASLENEEQRLSTLNDLKNSELRYRRLFETARDAILILDGDTGEIIDANPFILELLGYSLEYCLGKHLWELGFINDKVFAKFAFTELKTKGHIQYQDLPLRTKDGRDITVDFISHAFYLGDKKIFQCSIRDITYRKVLEDSLKESELRYRCLFEKSRDGILILDYESETIIDANQSILDMTGYLPKEVTGMSLQELGFIEVNALLGEAFSHLRTYGYARYGDIRLKGKNGEIIPVDLVSNVYMVKGKKIVQCNIREVGQF